jgi:hypothetical protein
MLDENQTVLDMESLAEIDVALSLNCVGENLRMVVLHLNEAILLNQQAAKAFESGKTEDVNTLKKFADVHHVQALNYSKLAGNIVDALQA